ncbi:MAG: aminotransferase class V-fold PLP-dependent enzyme, partial [Lachnospiraceae bacterium]|nr:aminotransferase class V-fold PLP-dependent enzyme [Lachnospiraceae bacterium]
LGSDAEALRSELQCLPVHLIENPSWQEGQGTSVARGAQAVMDGDFSAVVFMVGDQPFVETKHLDRLMKTYEEMTGEYSIVASAHNGLTGTPALFGTECFEELSRLSGSKGAKRLFGHYPLLSVEQEDDWFFFDVDTPEAFEQAEQEWLLRYGLREDFPLLMEQDIAYLDSAATAQMPQCVMGTMQNYEYTSRANVHRGLYPLAERSDEAYEQSRGIVAGFFGVDPNQVIFTHGATESLNLAVFGWAKYNLTAGDLVLVDTAGHHSNIVPWQMLVEQNGIRLAFLSLDEQGRIDGEAWCRLLQEKPKAVALTMVSNVTGYQTEIERLARQAHEVGAAVIVDCAQAAGHMPLPLEKLGVDFAAVSAHKMYGPFGIGALWVAPQRWQEMKPVYGGGGMIRRVTEQGVRYANGPECFEAGTPNITAAIGFAAACRYLQDIGLEKIQRHGQSLCRLAAEQLSAIPGVQLVGDPIGAENSSLVSFVLEGVHPHDLAQELAEQGVCVRAGNHCAMPLHKRLGISASVRVSFGVYSRRDDVNRLTAGVRLAKEKSEYEQG